MLAEQNISSSEESDMEWMLQVLLIDDGDDDDDEDDVHVRSDAGSICRGPGPVHE
jgi:hypothetical protein